MTLIAGVDIGNATTEVALADVAAGAPPRFLASAIVSTTGIKGTQQNTQGVFQAITQALQTAGRELEQLDLIRINEAAPVIGDVAMETISETIITESTMIGHNPSTPGGLGVGVGTTIRLDDLGQASAGEPYIVVADHTHGFLDVAARINEAAARVNITGAILQLDDGVLVDNRLTAKIPIVDEVKLIDKVPIGMPAAIEVAEVGRIVETLSNPYGIATMFGLSPDETASVVPMARSLVGNRSAVVIKTPAGDVTERHIPAGSLRFLGDRTAEVDVDRGAQEIMHAAESVGTIRDIKGEPGTNIGGMMEKVRVTMGRLTDRDPAGIEVTDLLAVDTNVPQKVTGGVAGEFSLEAAVGIAVMVKADRLQMQRIAEEMTEQFAVRVEVGGVEADMAIRGALTTPGTSVPIAILDMGAGSTDASVLREGQPARSVHLAGAGNMVTLLIKMELGLDSEEDAENIKRYPLARVETLFSIRHEDGTVQFFDEPLAPELFARTVVLHPDGMIPLPLRRPLEVIRQVRIHAKQRVFVTNAMRALAAVSPTNNVRDIAHVVLVGGSALDFEIPQFVTHALAEFRVVAGRANTRGTEGPRNAVATGLVLAWEAGR
ncbi:diol dehydratase reactivase subunit alpha [Propionibacterium freudenreichii]|uniref:diol dehydratase reactivase subunit alpha n=1 Tax=Propionibacterium freudenreichii TaxID=1744 RepID=UPI00254A8345|nr:diol dehydratase reactivase subunit alpha [Propionibacterium freudenreichii]MDK9300721.1 diol dehydratase reactivase subunit alpha [Propionibacterium freudenreichii]MDK9322126.1 diol dehydratase reactivase subunit alpha [Propionibacterium freudenreichii]MDK9322972.1 diol dehydratase reactivase subunit alpha [Propionibacterium freudenreichii]MDK9339252.1 diol dehydratase reactivase subunit alpha [Propionibacterium freudenreichii]MDK9647643.1 diol dehydratase reactivase subunit alpha [Propion